MTMVWKRREIGERSERRRGRNEKQRQWKLWIRDAFRERKTEETEVRSKEAFKRKVRWSVGTRSLPARRCQVVLFMRMHLIMRRHLQWSQSCVLRIVNNTTHILVRRILDIYKRIIRNWSHLTCLFPHHPKPNFKVLLWVKKGGPSLL